MSAVAESLNNACENILELRNITKTFPGVKALDNVGITVKTGEIHALMGENGAGKSTLIKIICGVYQPDSGDIIFQGEKVSFSNPRKAFYKGISVVHQERNLVPTFTVAENILMDQIAGKDLKRIDWKKLYQEAQKYIDMVGLDLSPYQNVESLSAGKKQMIEIARALSYNAKLLILDEPTASISLKEADMLLETIRTLQKQGMTFIYVSHKIEEVFKIADCVTVLRDGKNASQSIPINELDRDTLITLMVGRTENKQGFPSRDLSGRPVVLEVKNLRSVESPKPKSFKLYEGEILGWYGLVGAGRTELAKVLIGDDPATGGEILIYSKPVKIRSVKEAMQKHQIVYVSENRQEEGLFLQHDIVHNIAASIWKRISSKMGFVKSLTEKENAEYYVKKLNIKTPSIYQLVHNLSGGNRQKVCIAKGLSANPKIIIFDEPTVGIDIKTKREIHELIWELANNGISIIVISSDMAEIIQLADRLIVFRNGEICGELENCKVYDTTSVRVMDMITKN